MGMFEKFGFPALSPEEKMINKQRKNYEGNAKDYGKEVGISKDEIIEIDAYAEKTLKEDEHNPDLNELGEKFGYSDLKLDNPSPRENDPKNAKRYLLEGTINNHKIKIELMKAPGYFPNIEGTINGNPLPAKDAMDVFKKYQNVAAYRDSSIVDYANDKQSLKKENNSDEQIKKDLSEIL